MIAAANVPRAQVTQLHARHRVIACLAAVIALFAASRGVSAAASRCEAHAIRSHETLLARTLENWEPVDDQTVLIWTNHSPRAHLVKLSSPLAGLTSAEVITLVDGDDDQAISPCGHDGLRIGDAQEAEEAVRIVSIELLSARRTAELDPGTHPPALAAARI